VCTIFVPTTAKRGSHGWLQRASRAVLGLGIATVYGVTVVPLLVSEDEETKSEERSPLTSLHYPTSSSSSSRASSRLSSYRTHSPALRYSPVRRGDSIYYPATPERSPTPLEHPIDWDPVYHHGAANSTLVPSTTSSRTCVDPIDYALRRVYSGSKNRPDVWMFFTKVNNPTHLLTWALTCECMKESPYHRLSMGPKMKRTG
jgi:hypothetical protein